MRHRCVFFSFCLALVIFVGLGSNAAGQAPMDCTTQAFEDLGLTDIDGRAVTINNAEIVAAAAPLPEHCFVRGLLLQNIILRSDSPLRHGMESFIRSEEEVGTEASIRNGSLASE